MDGWRQAIYLYLQPSSSPENIDRRGLRSLQQIQDHHHHDSCIIHFSPSPTFNHRSVVVIKQVLNTFSQINFFFSNFFLSTIFLTLAYFCFVTLCHLPTTPNRYVCAYNLWIYLSESSALAPPSTSPRPCKYIQSSLREIGVQAQVATATGTATTTSRNETRVTIIWTENETERHPIETSI